MFLGRCTAVINIASQAAERMPASSSWTCISLKLGCSFAGSHQTYTLLTPLNISRYQHALRCKHENDVHCLIILVTLFNPVDSVIVTFATHLIHDH